MMNYEEFKQTVREELEKLFPEEYEIDIRTVQKVNQELDGITVIRRDAKVNSSPTIYAKDMYKEYENGKRLDEILTSAHLSIMENMENGERIAALVDFDAAKENIVFELINTEQNKSLLQNVPNRSWNDLSIIYRWIMESGREGNASAIVTHNLAERLGLNEEQLFDLAKENTKRLRPVQVESMSDIIKEMLLEEDLPKQIQELILPIRFFQEHEMYVITNNGRTNGAAGILYEEELHKLSEQLGADLYILPSSIHETIAISADFGTPEELTRMVQEVNAEELEPEDKLSDNVYHYDRETREITLAMDAPAIGKERDLAEDIQVQTAPTQDEPTMNKINPILGRGR